MTAPASVVGWLTSGSWTTGPFCGPRVVPRVFEAAGAKTKKIDRGNAIRGRRVWSTTPRTPPRSGARR
eukprot:9312472-Lingulodinium_polyedra.AAC.1